MDFSRRMCSSRSGPNPLTKPNLTSLNLPTQSPSLSRTTSPTPIDGLNTHGNRLENHATCSAMVILRDHTAGSCRCSRPWVATASRYREKPTRMPCVSSSSCKGSFGPFIFGSLIPCFSLARMDLGVNPGLPRPSYPPCQIK